MFVRRKKLPGDRVKVQVVKAVRSGGKVRQRVLRHVGTATSAAQLEQLEGLARLVIEEMRDADGSRTALFSPKEFVDLLEQSRRAVRDPAPFGTDLADCREESRVVVGVREAFGAVYDLLGWDRLFGARRASANRIVKELVLARIARPLSKRATVRELDAHGELALDLDYVYRSMDMLDDGRIKAIRRRSLEVAKTLLPEPLTAIFYDTTSLYFESDREDGLRLKGYSKDGKPHRVQVVFALLVTAEGLPVGYELFPGSTYEGHTLVTALEALERDHAGVRFTVVADAGMISRDNETALQARGTPYILGARLKSRPAAQKRRILDPDGYGPWGRDECARSIGSFQCVADGERRLVVTHSPKRARKDARERERRIEKLRARLETGDTPASVSNRGAARFLDFPDGKVRLNEAKVAEAARWDGLRGIVAWGCDEADPRDLVVQYRRLSEIEACFRANKHDLRIRPVFHRKERRVRAHIAICYMAFCCLQHVRHRLAAHGDRMSPDRIRRALNDLQIGILHDARRSRTFGLPSAASSDARKIYRTLGLKWNPAPFVYERRERKKPS